MGSVEPYETSKGRRYRVRYRDPDRRSREKGGFARKVDAEEYLAGVRVQAARGEYVDPSSARTTVGELGTPWLTRQNHLKASSLRPVEIAWRKHVQPTWGDRSVGRVQHTDVEAWVASLTASGLSATSVLRAHGVLASILDGAVRDRRLSSNPARGVNLPRKSPKRRAYLSAAQVELLARESGSYCPLVLFLAYTGLRWGEAIALRVESTDLLRRRVQVTENAVRVGRDLVVGTPKSHSSRSVPVPAFLVEHLARACEGKSRDQLVFGEGRIHLHPPNSRDGWFVASVRRAQAIDPEFPRVTLHDLRHTAASLAVSTGAHVKAVQRMLGHASAAMTLDTYADLFDADLDAVSDALDELRARTVVGDLWGKQV